MASASEIAQIVAAVLNAQAQADPESYPKAVAADEAMVAAETPSERAARKARPSSAKVPRSSKAPSGPRATSARTRKAPSQGTDTTWTVKSSWKGQAPTSGLLWKGRTCGVTPKVLATADKYALSCAIAAKLGRTLVIEP